MVTVESTLRTASASHCVGVISRGSADPQGRLILYVHATRTNAINAISVWVVTPPASAMDPDRELVAAVAAGELTVGVDPSGDVDLAAVVVVAIAPHGG